MRSNQPPEQPDAEPCAALSVARGSALSCPQCGLPMKLSDGWIPSYNDPDNASGSPEAEPHCPTCDELERENLRNYEPMSRSATVMPLNFPSTKMCNSDPLDFYDRSKFFL